MRTLYHTYLCPFSRRIRLQLNEKKLDYKLENEKAWEQRPDFLEMSPSGELPVFLDLDGTVVADCFAIGEFIEEKYPDRGLLGKTLAQRAEVRRLVSWFDRKFNREVSQNLVFQKTLKRYYGLGGPESALIREGQSKLNDHLEYISWLLEQRHWLAGEELSLADFAAAAHLSCADYLGDVHWHKHPEAKEWFARIKSRPAFRPLLEDRFPALPPASHYMDLDF